MADILNTAYLDASNSTGDNLTTGFINDGEVGLPSDLSVGGSLSVGGAVDASSGQVSALSLSIDTLASSGITVGSSTAAGVLFITIGASGMSIGVESGGSLYYVNSTVSAA